MHCILFHWPAEWNSSSPMIVEYIVNDRIYKLHAADIKKWWELLLDADESNWTLIITSRWRFSALVCRYSSTINYSASSQHIMKSLMAALFSLLLLAIASLCCVSAAKTTNDGTDALLLNGTGAAADATTTSAEHRHYCPLTCFCDFESSIVSCAGTEEEPIDVILGLNRSLFNNTTSITETVVPPAIPNDVWSVIAAADIQRLDVRDLLLQRLDSHLILNGTERLVELSLVRCGLALIANDTFADHSNLERLDLSQNQLTILSQVRTISRWTCYIYFLRVK